MLDDIIEMHRAGRLAEAEAGYRELLAVNPDDAEVLHLLGILRGQSGDRDEGLALVQRAIERDPARDVFQHTLGEMHLHAGRLDESEAAYLRAKELNPNLTSAHNGLGQIALLRGDLESAEQHFRIALRADENDAQSLAGLGNIHLARGELRQASAHLTRAAELAPNDALIQGSLANVMLALNTPDFAIRAARNALALKPDYAMARQVLANALLAKGDLQGAHEAFAALLAQGEHLAAAHLGLGDVARARQQHDEAMEHYQQALQRNPELHHAAIRRADSMGRSDRADQAILELQERARQYPEAPYVKVALASLLSQRGRYAEALPVWREAAAVLPENGNVQANLAWAMDCVGEYEEAANLVEHLGGPPRPALLLVRARVALGARDPRRTLETLRSLDESGWADRPELARRRWKLSGLAHDALEQWDEAAADFRRTLSSSAPALPQLPPLDQATGDLLRKHAAEPDLQDPQIAAPILLTGLPGSGAGRLATMLGDQEQLVVRRNRTGLDTGFLPLEEPAQRLSQSDLETLHWRYARPLRRSGLPDDALIIDWLPYLDARALPALKRALPGLRILKVQCDPRDALLNWLAFANAELLMPDPLAAARWLKAAATHLALAEELLPVFNVDLEAVQANREGPEGKALAGFLGLELLRSGPLQDAMAKRLRGMPATFHPGHADRYREALAEAFAALE